MVASSHAAAASCQLRVGTFNIRCICKSDKGARSLGERRWGLADYANKLKCDVIGFQEVTPSQLDFLKSRMSDYAFVATFRERNRKSGEASPVAYRRSRFDLEGSGTFWLSSTPDKPGSRSWKTSLPRICTYAILRGSPRVRPHWWSKSGGVTEYLVNCSPCDAQGTFKRTDATTW